MPFLDRVRSRLVLVGRVTMWASVALLVLVGLWQNAPAWAAATADCPGSDTTGNTSIPITPVKLYLIFGGPAQTYSVSLCKDPNEPVNVTVQDSPKGDVTVSPAQFSLNSTVPQTVSVGVDPKHQAKQPFEVTLTHSATSEDPEWDFGSLKVPQVTAYYSPPVGVRDVVVLRVGQSANINVLGNDIDRLGQDLSLTNNAVTVAPKRGTTTVNNDDTIKYTPTTNRPASDQFQYQVNDAIGNTDEAKVLILTIPANAQNPQTLDVDQQDGGQLIFPTEGGSTEVDVPALDGISSDANVVCIVAQQSTTSGNLPSRPIVPSRFTGLVFYVQCSVDGEPVTEAMLASPVNIFVPLTAEFLQQFGATELSVLNWDGDQWHKDGVEILSGQGASTLHVNTTIFGEFAVFSQSQLRLPLLGNR